MAIESHGAKAVHLACCAADAGRKADLAALLGIEIPTLGIVHAADTAAFDRLTPAERDQDLAEANADLSSLAATLGRRGGLKGGRSTSPAKAAAARANGKKGGSRKA
jgi:hypothetical protein